jgi:hypothetical protein
MLSPGFGGSLSRWKKPTSSTYPRERETERAGKAEWRKSRRTPGACRCSELDDIAELREVASGGQADGALPTLTRGGEPEAAKIAESPEHRKGSGSEGWSCGASSRLASLILPTARKVKIAGWGAGATDCVAGAENAMTPAPTLLALMPTLPQTSKDSRL